MLAAITVSTMTFCPTLGVKCKTPFKVHVYTKMSAISNAILYFNQFKSVGFLWVHWVPPKFIKKSLKTFSVWIWQSLKSTLEYVLRWRLSTLNGWDGNTMDVFMQLRPLESTICQQPFCTSFFCTNPFILYTIILSIQH